MLTRRLVISAVAATATLGLASSASFAQDGAYPNRSVRLVIPYPPGGPTDLVGRLVAQRLSDLWKQPVVVDNRAGASGTIGSEMVARAAPDGYTLLLGNNASQGAFELLNPSTSSYKTLKDFAPVALVGVAPLVMIVAADVPAKDIKEFIAYAKANPTKINYASAAIGSSPHFASELLKLETKIEMQHIPFNGTAPALQAMNSGTVQVYMGGASSVMPQVQAGKARALGAVSENRINAVKDLPTMKEQGINVAWDSWYGLLAPAAVPPAILDKINADVSKVLDGDVTREELDKLGFTRKLGSRAQFSELLKNEIARTERIIKDSKMEVK